MAHRWNREKSATKSEVRLWRRAAIIAIASIFIWVFQGQQVPSPVLEERRSNTTTTAQALVAERKNRSGAKNLILGYAPEIVKEAHRTILESTVPLVAPCFQNSTVCPDQQQLSLPQHQSSLDTCQAFRLKTGQPSTEVLQTIHLKQALQEECIAPTLQQLTRDHEKARNTVNGCPVGIVFPRSLVGYTACGVWQPKTVTYMFRGIETPMRKWVLEYANNANANVQFTKSGRNVRKETGVYDYEYYDAVMAARFVLAPDGDFPWTYRFLEALMCGAIPIVPHRLQPEEQEVGYEYCVHGILGCPLMHNETARQEAAQRNWLRFLGRHTLVME